MPRDESSSEEAPLQTAPLFQTAVSASQASSSQQRKSGCKSAPDTRAEASQVREDAQLPFRSPAEDTQAESSSPAETANLPQSPQVPCAKDIPKLHSQKFHESDGKIPPQAVEQSHDSPRILRHPPSRFHPLRSHTHGLHPDPQPRHPEGEEAHDHSDLSPVSRSNDSRADTHSHSG